MELNKVIEEMINEEVEKRVENYKSNYNSLKKLYDDTVLLLQQEKANNKEFENNTFKFEILNSLSKNINVDNIEEVVISNLGFKYSKISFDGMDSKSIPEWFKILCRYFDNKDDVLNIFNLFNIEYPSWAKNIVLPSHYDKNTLELCLSRTNQLYVPNGQIYDGNMGFYYRQFKGQKFNVAEVFRYNSYVSIPYQLLLKNRLLIEDDELFNSFVEVLENGKSHYQYLLPIVKYQDVPIEKVKRILNTAKSGDVIYKSAISKHPELLKVDDIGQLFKANISDYHGSEFYITKFNKKIQKEYFMKQEFKRDSYDTFKFIKMIDDSNEFTTEEKAELIKQCYLNVN